MDNTHFDLERYRLFVVGNKDLTSDEETLLEFRNSRFSWLAFFVSWWYFVYRKLYVEAAVACIVSVGIAVISFEASGNTLDIVLRFAYHVALGFLFYPLYRWKFRRLQDASEDELRAKGGTSGTVAAITFVVCCLVVFGIALGTVR